MLYLIIFFAYIKSALSSTLRKESEVAVSRGKDIAFKGEGQPTLKLNNSVKVQSAACTPLPSVITKSQY